jgi:hypothetical protein
METRVRFVYLLAVVSGFGVAFAIFELYHTRRNYFLARESNGAKQIIATNNFVTAVHILIAQVTCLSFATVFISVVGEDFQSPLSSIVSAILTSKTIFRWRSRRMLQRHVQASRHHVVTITDDEAAAIERLH